MTQLTKAERDMLTGNIEHARSKHPWRTGMAWAEKYRAAEHELHEMGVAMLKNDTRGQRLYGGTGKDYNRG